MNKLIASFSSQNDVAVKIEGIGIAFFGASAFNHVWLPADKLSFSDVSINENNELVFGDFTGRFVSLYVSNPSLDLVKQKNHQKTDPNTLHKWIAGYLNNIGTRFSKLWNGDVHVSIFPLGNSVAGKNVIGSTVFFSPSFKDSEGNEYSGIMKWLENGGKLIAFTLVTWNEASDEPVAFAGLTHFVPEPYSDENGNEVSFDGLVGIPVPAYVPNPNAFKFYVVAVYLPPTGASEFSLNPTLVGIPEEAVMKQIPDSKTGRYRFGVLDQFKQPYPSILLREVTADGGVLGDETETEKLLFLGEGTGVLTTVLPSLTSTQYSVLI